MKKQITESIRIKKGQFALLKIMTVVLVAVIILLNVSLGFLGDRVNLKVDLTKDGILSFSDATKDTLKNLDKEVLVYSLIPEGDTSEITVTFKEIIEKYAKLSSKIKYSVVDTNKNPAFLNKYASLGESFSQYTVIFETDKRYKTVDLYDAVSVDTATQTVQTIKAEELFTSAIMYVTRETDTKIGVVTGHGEIGSSEYFSELFSGEGYVAESVNLLSGEINDEINTLIITTPQTDYTQEEIDAIDKFLNKGNNLQVLIDVTNADLTNIYAYLNGWGISYMDGFMLETDPNYYYQTPIYLMPEVQNTDATYNIAVNGLRVLAPTFRAIAPVSNESVTETVLLKTSASSVCKVNLNSQTVDVEDGDIKGAQSLLSLYTKKTESGETAKILVSGGTGIIARDVFQSGFANQDFYFNIISYMSGDESGIYIRPKDISTNYVAMPLSSGIIYTALTVIAIPLILIIAGIVIWIRRRHL